MKLYVVEFTNEETQPAVYWCGSATEAVHFVTTSPAIADVQRDGAKIRVAELPKGRTAIAAWLNAQGAGGWR